VLGGDRATGGGGGGHDRAGDLDPTLAILGDIISSSAAHGIIQPPRRPQRWPGTSSRSVSSSLVASVPSLALPPGSGPAIAPPRPGHHVRCGCRKLSFWRRQHEQQRAAATVFRRDSPAIVAQAFLSRSQASQHLQPPDAYLRPSLRVLPAPCSPSLVHLVRSGPSPKFFFPFLPWRWWRWPRRPRVVGHHAGPVQQRVGLRPHRYFAPCPPVMIHGACSWWTGWFSADC
jgi:hypothetical protein